MSTNPSDRSPSRPKSKVKIGLQADFEQMLSALPDDDSQPESETVQDEIPADVSSTNRPTCRLQADFSQMLSGLPTAPEKASTETVEEEDFRVKRKGPQFIKPEPRRAESQLIKPAAATPAQVEDVYDKE